MAEFDKLLFLQTLRELPERRSPLREPHYNKYLAQVFDGLRKNSSLDLMALDLSAVSLHDLTPKGYSDVYRNVAQGWAQGLNHFLKETPAAYLKQKTFFYFYLLGVAICAQVYAFPFKVIAIW